MTEAKTNNIKHLLEAMWQNYLELTPDARKIHDLFAGQNNGRVINDHIALRTFNLDKVNLEKVARPFLNAGYVAGGDYEFPGRKLVAKHFQHPDDTLPKVFISELLVEELSENAQRTIHNLVDQVSEDSVLQDNFCFSGRPWEVSLKSYEELLQESEYAAWVAALGYRPNHFTVSINHLQSHDDIHVLNQMLQDTGFILNESGGLVKGSPEVLLEQSSTMAGKVNVNFSDGEREIPSCFYEFAKRYALPDGHLYQGFVAASADKIFESTDTQ
ncbi:MAG: DUF1338 domain-containing protein [Endozoicomonas sp.]|uniref:DUF1338 domain-containing protein n=1 Tax=Endozoicomonas sp. TaxID=1892382 RepID=UPI003D9B7550